MINFAKCACFLVTHGSTNPQALIFLNELVRLMRSQSHVLIGGGLLEGSELSLEAQLQEFGGTAQGYRTIAIFPIFLLAGVHVLVDIPEAVAIARSHLPDLELIISPHFGTYPQVLDLLQTKFTMPNQGTKILVAHGSRQVGANQDIVALAQKLQAIAAFGSGEQSLETQVELLIAKGEHSITVLPYFLSSSLLAGGVGETIAKRIMIYGDRLQINLLPSPFDPPTIAKLLLKVFCDR